jgi:penicillin-binding protein 1A
VAAGPRPGPAWRLCPVRHRLAVLRRWPAVERETARLPAALAEQHPGVDGQPVGTFARERRVELAYDEYPPLVIQAMISAEDKTFFSHGGIDYPGLLGAVGDFAVKQATGGPRARGGSTITQQVAKALLQDDEYAVSRKIREAILSFGSRIR